MTADPNRFAPGATLTIQDVADLIDHALLKPELTPDDVQRSVREVAAQRIWSVCVRPSDVADTRATLASMPESPTRVCTVIGFPHGTTSTAAKAAESRQALADGAAELDMVVNIGRLRGGDLETVRSDIAAVVETGHAASALVKVILETSLLDDHQIAAGCEAAAAAGADFVKTSTGFAGGGATVPHVRLMRHSVPAPMQVKASGGVRDLPTLVDMLAAGATRIGTSSTAHLLDEAQRALAAGPLVVPQQPREDVSGPGAAY